MNLNEAKQELKEHGYIIAEDTETNDEEYDQIGNEIDDWEKDWYDPKAKKLLNQHLKLSNRHMDLEDKIKNAKKYNEANPIWNELSDKEKVAAIKKMIEEDGLSFNDENPMNPDSSDIFADFFDIPKCQEVYEKATDKLEDIYLKNGYRSAEWDDFLMSYLNEIMLDVLNGHGVKQIVSDYRC